MSAVLNDPALSTGRTASRGALALVAGVVVAVVIIYWPSYRQMIDMWSLQNYQHGWLVYPISLAMLWHVRERLATVRLEASPAGVVALGLTVAGWTMANAVNVQVLELLAVTLLVPASVWAFGGAALLREALFPLLFLLAAVPAGEAIIPALMQSTADIAAWLLDVVGVPAYREGMFMTLPGGQFEVADVCSGLRYLLAGTVLAVLFAYWNYRSYTKRVVFVVSLAGAFIIANGIRAFIVMYVASATDMRVFAGRDHVIFGQVLFAALALALMWFGSRYADRDLPAAGKPAAGRSPRWRPVVILTALAVLALGPFARYFNLDAAKAATLPLAPAMPPGCAALPDWAPRWQPRLSSPAAESRLSWRCGDVVVSVYQAAYREQRQGRELVSAQHELWPYTWRRRLHVGERQISLASGEVTATEIYRPDDSRATLAWFFYDVDGTRTRNPFVVKWLEALNALRLHTPNAALVAIVAEGRGGDRQALEIAARRAAGGL